MESLGPSGTEVILLVHTTITGNSELWLLWILGAKTVKVSHYAKNPATTVLPTARVSVLPVNSRTEKIPSRPAAASRIDRIRNMCGKNVTWPFVVS